MNDTGNGNHVTWRELRLYIEPMKEDLADVRSDVKTLIAGQDKAAGALLAAAKATDSRRFWTTIAASFVTAVVAGGIGSLLYLAFT